MICAAPALPAGSHTVAIRVGSNFYPNQMIEVNSGIVPVIDSVGPMEVRAGTELVISGLMFEIRNMLFLDS